MSGIDKAGFSSTQEAYEKAYDVFFNAIDKLEFILKDRPFLTGSKVTEADVRLFPVRLIQCQAFSVVLRRSSTAMPPDYHSI